MKRYWLTAVVIVIAGGCGGDKPPTRPAAAPTVVSAACSGAMRALANLGIDGTDQQERDAQLATVRSCNTHAEWLQAVKPYTNKGNKSVVIGSTKPSEVLAAFCAGNDAEPACTH